MTDRTPPPSRRLSIVLAVMACAIAFGLAVWTTRGLDWPCESDFYRDMGTAQSMLDGLYPADPSYAGEIGWYNPLLPGLVAMLTKLTSTPLHVVYATAGPYLNLLGPLFFFLFVALLADWPSALFALVAYLFWGILDQPSWYYATYSPWLWPLNFSQGVFFAAMCAYVRATRSTRVSWELAAGFLLGLTFLCHTAPAAIGALTILVHSLVIAIRGGEPRGRALRRLVTTGMVAFVVSLPFLVPLFVRYRFHIVNRVPSGFVAITGSFVIAHLVSFVTVGAVVGFVVIVSRVRRGAEPTDSNGVLLPFAAAVCALLAYGMAAQTLEKRFAVELVQLVPAIHFHIYFRAVQEVFFGIGFAAVVDAGAAWLERRRGRDGGSAVSRVWIREVAIVASVVVLIGVRLPAYARSVDVAQFRVEAVRLSAAADRNALYDWALAHVEPHAVFLTSNAIALYSIAAAGRKVVALDPWYSSPYVEYGPRVADRDAMFAALRAGDRAGFESTASRYDVGFVVVDDAESEACCAIRADALAAFQEAFRAGTIHVFRVP